MTVALIGEAPGGPVPATGPLSGASGRALARYAGVPFERVLACRRLNVYESPPGVWRVREARERGTAALRAVWAASQVVACGRRVADAIGVGDLDWFETSGRVLVIPHPSGRNLVWNDPTVRRRAREVLGPILRRA